MSFGYNCRKANESIISTNQSQSFCFLFNFSHPSISNLNIDFSFRVFEFFELFSRFLEIIEQKFWRQNNSEETSKFQFTFYEWKNIFWDDLWFLKGYSSPDKKSSNSSSRVSLAKSWSSFWNWIESQFLSNRYFMTNQSFRIFVHSFFESWNFGRLLDRFIKLLWGRFSHESTSLEIIQSDLVIYKRNFMGAFMWILLTVGRMTSSLDWLSSDSRPIRSSSISSSGPWLDRESCDSLDFSERWEFAR